jgi:hypothetical protein
MSHELQRGYERLVDLPVEESRNDSIASMQRIPNQLPGGIKMRARLPILVSVLITGPAFADSPVIVATTGLPTEIGSLDELVRMNECQLLDLYKRAEPGAIPSGYASGRMISKPGRLTTVPVSRITKLTVWQGKYFDGGPIMTNRMFGVRFIKGEVQHGESWIDGRPSNIIDYGPTSLLWRSYRDEFREVAPGIYLGIMFKREGCKSKIVTYFALNARDNCCQRCHGK